MSKQNRPAEWKLLSAKVVFDNYTKLEERIYLMPDGRRGPYYIKINRPAASVVAMTVDGQFIVVEQFRPGPGKVLCELPGGFIEPGEEPLAAIARELLEETGYKGDLEFVTTAYEDSVSDMVHHGFVARNCVKVAEQDLESTEFIAVRLLSLEDFRRLARSGEMTDVEMALLGLDRLGLLN